MFVLGLFVLGRRKGAEELAGGSESRLAAVGGVAVWAEGEYKTPSAVTNTAEGVRLAEDVVEWEPQPAAGAFSSGSPAGVRSTWPAFLMLGQV